MNKFKVTIQKQFEWRASRCNFFISVHYVVSRSEERNSHEARSVRGEGEAEGTFAHETD